MAHGNIVFYNVYVVLLSILFSVFIFLIAGSTVVFALTILSYVTSELMPAETAGDWPSILAVCMITLTTIIVLVNLYAICINVRFTSLEKMSKQKKSAEKPDPYAFK